MAAAREFVEIADGLEAVQAGPAIDTAKPAIAANLYFEIFRCSDRNACLRCACDVV